MMALCKRCDRNQVHAYGDLCTQCRESIRAANEKELASVRAEVALTAQVVLALRPVWVVVDGKVEVAGGGPIRECAYEQGKLVARRARQAELEQAVRP